MSEHLTGEQRRVLDWADAARRDLPWRRTRDPWSVLVAEVMLQQTQVERVVPRWHAFLERFPTTEACAAAPLADVLVEWSGLGYPRRARNLHLTAAAVEASGGTIPDRLEELLSFPGIGPYTARAVLAFAFDQDVAVLDTNVGRVLARRAGRSLRPREAQVEADAWAPPGHGWAWNQGLLDLGAMRCRPSEPDCTGCPVRRTCRWARSGWVTPDPASGSAAVSTAQARFEGSSRQARGRLLRALHLGPVALGDVGAVVGWDDRPDDAAEVADSLVRDGLARRRGDRFSLP